MKKKITMRLDPNSISKAINELKDYREEFKKRVRLFMERLTEAGAMTAKLELVDLGAIATAELLNSIEHEVMYTDGGNKGVIFSNCKWACFVEFGTGVMGEGSPHPSLPWAYDINNHGEAGWTYFDENEGRFRWTKGMPSRPFMFNTARELERIAPEIAKGVFQSR